MVKRDYDDSEVNKLWPLLKAKMPEFFEGLDIKPSLLHGDLWSGNAGQVGSDPGTDSRSTITFQKYCEFVLHEVSKKYAFSAS